MATGSHEFTPKEATPQPAKRSRASSEAPEPVRDELKETFLKAHEYIMRDCFVYSFLMTMLRAILALNYVEGFVRGRHFNYFGTFEGQDVLRFFCLLYTVAPAKTIDILRGGAMSRETRNARYKGVFDLRNLNLPGVPSPAG